MAQPRHLLLHRRVQSQHRVRQRGRAQLPAGFAVWFRVSPRHLLSHGLWHSARVRQYACQQFIMVVRFQICVTGSCGRIRSYIWMRACMLRAPTPAPVWPAPCRVLWHGERHGQRPYAQAFATAEHVRQPACPVPPPWAAWVSQASLSPASSSVISIPHQPGGENPARSVRHCRAEL